MCSSDLHWIYEDAEYFKGWITLIALANTSSQKFKLGNEIFTITRGQLAYSQRNLSTELGKGIKWVRTFLKLLEKDDMISVKTIGKGKQSSTLININRYSDFQATNETQEDTQRKRKGNAKGIQSNNDNKDNNKKEKEDIFIPPTIEEINDYAISRNKQVNAEQIFNYYDSNNWKDKNDNPVKNWKRKISTVWFKNAPDLDISKSTSIPKIVREYKLDHNRINTDIRQDKIKDVDVLLSFWKDRYAVLSSFNGKTFISTLFKYDKCNDTQKQEIDSLRNL